MPGLSEALASLVALERPFAGLTAARRSADARLSALGRLVVPTRPAERAEASLMAATEAIGPLAECESAPSGTSPGI
jgi:hypothetical protein